MKCFSEGWSLLNYILVPHKLCAVISVVELCSQKSCSVFQCGYYMYMMLQIKRNNNGNLSMFQSNNRANMVDLLKQGWAMLDHQIPFFAVLRVVFDHDY